MPPPDADPDYRADLGALMGPIVHETANFLNALLMQIALLESTVPSQARAELDDIRRQGAKLGAVLRLVQQRRQPRESGNPVDWNEIIRETAAGCELALAPDLPLVPGPAGDLDRLVRFLLKVTSSGSVTSRRTDESAVLEMNCSAEIGRLIEIRTIEPEHEHALEIAACQAIVRWRGGTLRTANAVVVVTLPLASTNDGRG